MLLLKSDIDNAIAEVINQTNFIKGSALKNFEQEFSFYQDFPQSQTLSQVEKALIPKLVDQIILDLFNKIAGDW